MGLREMLLAKKGVAKEAAVNVREDSLRLHKKRLEKQKRESLDCGGAGQAEAGSPNEGSQVAGSGAGELEPTSLYATEDVSRPSMDDSSDGCSHHSQQTFNQERTDSIMLAKVRIAKQHDGPSNLARRSPSPETDETDDDELPAAAGQCLLVAVDHQYCKM